MEATDVNVGNPLEEIQFELCAFVFGIFIVNIYDTP